jgi:hypothetical protein
METDSQRQRLFWTEEMDFLLSESIVKNGIHNWARVSQETGIDRKACRVRYNAVLAPINKSSFSKEEDVLLVHLVEKYGTKWVLISKQMFDRSDKQCQHRYRRLTEKKVEETGELFKGLTLDEEDWQYE